jgi:hypothetical protein
MTTFIYAQDFQKAFAATMIGASLFLGSSVKAEVDYQGIFMYIYIYVHVYICIQVYVSIFMNTCTYVCLCIHIYLSTYTYYVPNQYEMIPPNKLNILSFNFKSLCILPASKTSVYYLS